MTADGALSEDDQVTGQDVGTLDGDADGQGFVATRNKVVRPHADATPAEHIHAVVDDIAHVFRCVVLENGRGD